jgi:hypothetical protein
MDPSIIMLVIGVASALVFGPRIAQTTERHEKTYGGSAAQLLNLVACMAFVSLPLTILSGLIAQIVLQKHAPLLPVALSLLAVTFATLLLWAAIEMPARAKAPVATRTALNTWTAEDARKSGL